MIQHHPEPTVTVLRCQTCGASHELAAPLWSCPCGGLLDVEAPANFPWETMRQRPAGLWRYREALPLAPTTRPVSLGEMRTPLLAVDDAASRLYLKLDFLFPTGSFKDRGAAVLLSKVRELGVSQVVEDSSGNAGAAIAAYAAAAGVAAKIYVPASASAAKTGQIALYGAQLVQVPGTRADTTAAVQEETRQRYYASHVWNPFFLEGVKTIAFEIWEQLGGRPPDWVLTPVGHGTLLLGLFNGFDYLRRAAMIPALPRIVGVQAAAVAPLAAALKQSSLPEVTAGDTMAEGIAIVKPVRWQQILSAVRTSRGSIVTVTEPEIRQAVIAWARRGILMEATSAAALAAYAALSSAGWFAGADTVVAPVTGAGSKTIQLILA